MKKFLTLVLCLVMVISLFAACTKTPAVEEPADKPVVDKPAEDTPPADDEPEAPVDPNAADYTYSQDPGEPFDIRQYYLDSGFNDCNLTLKGKGGVVAVPDKPTTSIPKANEEYTIGFSIYYTVDEVGAMILDNMKKFAEEAGVKLLVNDANYDQNIQNQAIEQWIVEGVDGVCLGPCDFSGVKEALDQLEAANIPVVTLNAPYEGSCESAILGECIEQGNMAAQLLIDHLVKEGSDMKGTVVYQTLNFSHPNAATRAKGFIDAFKAYPDIEIVELTGVSPEDHYTAFEGALANYGEELIGAFGLYSSATIGMMNAAKANDSKVPITSIDNDKVILEGIYNGDLLGSCCYSSTAPAFWLMSSLVNKLNGLEIPSIYWYANMNVTKDNVVEAFEHYHNMTLEDYLANN